MTWEELNEKYPDTRDKMDKKRETEFVNDCFECYEQEGFSEKFWSPFDDYKDQLGKNFEVIERCSTKNSDLSSLPMWKIRFADGTVIGAYPEEIILTEMIANGYHPNGYNPKENIDNSKPIHLDIMDKISSYGNGVQERSKREIQEFLLNMDYDKDFVENINDDFCEGFGTAKDIIFELLKNKYWEDKIVDNDDKIKEK